MADILRKNYVALVCKLRSQEALCKLLVEHNIITKQDKEEVMCQRTNGGRNRLFLDLIRCRFSRAFGIFCSGLELTRQLELLELLDPNRDQFKKEEEEEQCNVDCKICLSYPVQSFFRPCGHACVCEICAGKVDKCQICRSAIEQRLKIFL